MPLPQYTMKKLVRWSFNLGRHSPQSKWMSVTYLLVRHLYRTVGWIVHGDPSPTSAKGKEKN